jgi:hypothetical protein
VRESSATELEQFIERVHDDGSLPKEVAFGDIGTLMVRLSRPLPGRLSREADTDLAQRHLDPAVAGMRTAVLSSTGRSAETSLHCANRPNSGSVETDEADVLGWSGEGRCRPQHAAKRSTASAIVPEPIPYRTDTGGCRRPIERPAPSNRGGSSGPPRW